MSNLNIETPIRKRNVCITPFFMETIEVQGHKLTVQVVDEANQEDTTLQKIIIKKLKNLYSGFFQLSQEDKIIYLNKFLSTKEIKEKLTETTNCIIIGGLPLSKIDILNADIVGPATIDSGFTIDSTFKILNNAITTSNYIFVNELLQTLDEILGESNNLDFIHGSDKKYFIIDELKQRLIYQTIIKLSESGIQIGIQTDDNVGGTYMIEFNTRELTQAIMEKTPENITESIGQKIRRFLGF